MSMNNPGSIVERLEEDAEPADYLFQFPGLSRVMTPWYDFKADLDKKHGFNFGISYTALYQKASDNIRTGGRCRQVSTSTLAAPGPFSAARRIHRRCLGSVSSGATHWAPRFRPRLCSRNSDLSIPGAAPFGENDPVVGEFWIQQKFANVVGFRVGQDLSHYGVRLLSVQKLPVRLRRFQSRYQCSHSAARQWARRIRPVQASTQNHAPPWCP